MILYYFAFSFWAFLIQPKFEKIYYKLSKKTEAAREICKCVGVMYENITLQSD